MKTLILPTLLICLCAFPLHAQPSCKLSDGKPLPPAKLEKFKSLLRSTPDKAAVHYAIALEYMEAGNSKQALEELTQSLSKVPWLDPTPEAAFKDLRSCDAFQNLVAQVQKKYPPLVASRLIHTIPLNDLIPEGIGSDPVDGTLYVSSVHHRKILKISSSGDISDFISEGQDGTLAVLGIKVDARDRSVWAATEAKGASLLFHFNQQGKTLAKYAPTQPGKHLFNDLAITSKGDVFVSDSEDGAVYKLAAGSKELIRVNLEGRPYPNGIALSPDEQTIYVAYGYGIVTMSLDGSNLTDLHAPDDVTLAQVDGLYYRKGNLIAIQNGLGENRIVELQLSPDGKRITAGRLLEFRSPFVELPTTGTIYKDNLIFMVNTQIDHEENGELVRPETLQPVRIATMKLN